MIKILFFLVLLNGQMLASPVIDRLIPTLIQVESNARLDVIGDNGKAYGQLQIWDVVVQDVNRVYGTSYTHKQMFNYYESIEVCLLYLTFWGKQYAKNEGKEPTFEVYSRIWNGGPRGYKKKATEKYWEKVKKALDSDIRIHKKSLEKSVDITSSDSIMSSH